MSRTRGISKRVAFGLQLGLSLALGAAFAWALAPHLQAVPTDLSVPAWVLPTFLATLVPYQAFRGLRWFAIVGVLGPVGLGEALAIAWAGSMWIALLPFRLGEFARPVFLAQRTSIPIERALGAVALERVIDGCTLCVVFFVSIGIRPLPAAHPIVWATLGLMGIMSTALLALAVMARWPTATGRIAAVFIRPLSHRMAAFVDKTVTSVAQGFAALPSRRALAACMVTTLGYWMSCALGIWVLARGCGLPLQFVDAVTVLAVMNIALMIPGGPAQFGTFQTGVLWGISLFASAEVVRNQGSVFAFYLYVGHLGIAVVLGLISQWSIGVSFRTRPTPP